MNAFVTSTGSFLPGPPLTNEEIDQRFREFKEMTHFEAIPFTRS